jgi:hypothetical protein
VFVWFGKVLPYTSERFFSGFRLAGQGFFRVFFLRIEGFLKVFFGPAGFLKVFFGLEGFIWVFFGMVAFRASHFRCRHLTTAGDGPEASLATAVWRRNFHLKPGQKA